MNDECAGDRNVERMVQAALEPPPSPGFQERLASRVLVEVARQRQQESPHLWWHIDLPWRIGWQRLAFTTAVLAVMGVAAVWLRAALAPREIGRVTALYGSVAVQSDGGLQAVGQSVTLKSGQRLLTSVGSRAEIVLNDQSRVLPEPRTTLHIDQDRHGPRIRLEQGTINLVAAKQAPGKAITIESGQSQIKVLGTRLEVRLVQKPSGSRQTRVHVLNGRVEMESAGRKILLPAGTEGIAGDHGPPERFSMVFEVGELIKLLNESPRGAALPGIIDVATGTLWSVVPAEVFEKTGPTGLSLRLRYPAFGVQAYTLDGAQVLATGSGAVLRLDLADLGTVAASAFILKVPGVGGLVQTTEDGGYECLLSGTESDPLSLIQLHLPATANLESISATVLESRQERDKLILTVTGRAHLPSIH